MPLHSSLNPASALGSFPASSSASSGGGAFNFKTGDQPGLSQNTMLLIAAVFIAVLLLKKSGGKS